MKNEKVVEAANKSRQVDLEDRLVDFACMCLEVCELLPASRAGQNLEYQLQKAEQLRH